MDYVLRTVSLCCNGPSLFDRLEEIGATKVAVSMAITQPINPIELWLYNDPPDRYPQGPIQDSTLAKITSKHRSDLYPAYAEAAWRVTFLDLPPVKRKTSFTFALHCLESLHVERVILHGVDLTMGDHPNANLHRKILTWLPGIIEDLEMEFFSASPGPINELMPPWRQPVASPG